MKTKPAENKEQITEWACCGKGLILEHPEILAINVEEDTRISRVHDKYKEILKKHKSAYVHSKTAPSDKPRAEFLYRMYLELIDWFEHAVTGTIDCSN